MEDDGYDRTDAEDSLEALFAELNGMLMVRSYPAVPR